MDGGHPFSFLVRFTFPDGIVWSDITDWTWTSVDAAVADLPVIDDSIDDQLTITWSADKVAHELNQTRKWTLSATVFGQSRPFLTERYYPKPVGTKGTNTSQTHDATVSIGDLVIEMEVDAIILEGSGNIDGGVPDSVYGGTTGVDGGQV